MAGNSIPETMCEFCINHGKRVFVNQQYMGFYCNAGVTSPFRTFVIAGDEPRECSKFEARI